MIRSCRSLVVASSVVVDAEFWLLVDMHGPFQIIQHFLSVYASKLLRFYGVSGLEFAMAKAVDISSLVVVEKWVFVNRSMR